LFGPIVRQKNRKKIRRARRKRNTRRIKRANVNPKKKSWKSIESRRW